MKQILVPRCPPSYFFHYIISSFHTPPLCVCPSPPWDHKPFFIQFRGNILTSSFLSWWVIPCNRTKRVRGGGRLYPQIRHQLLPRLSHPFSPDPSPQTSILLTSLVWFSSTPLLPHQSSPISYLSVLTFFFYSEIRFITKCKICVFD